MECPVIAPGRKITAGTLCSAHACSTNRCKKWRAMQLPQKRGIEAPRQRTWFARNRSKSRASAQALEDLPINELSNSTNSLGCTIDIAGTRARDEDERNWRDFCVGVAQFQQLQAAANIRRFQRAAERELKQGSETRRANLYGSAWLTCAAL